MLGTSHIQDIYASFRRIRPSEKVRLRYAFPALTRGCQKPVTR